MKRMFVVVVGVLLAGVPTQAADSVTITSQYSSIVSSASLYRDAGNGYTELLVTRSERDDSPAIGDRSALVETIAAAGGVSQAAAAQADVEIVQEPESTSLQVQSAFVASFQALPDTTLKKGNTQTDVRSDHNFIFKLARPHSVTITLVPTGNRTLPASASLSLYSFGGSETFTLSMSLNDAETRAATLRLDQGEYSIQSSAVAAGWGQFNLTTGEIIPLSGDAGLIMRFEFVPTGTGTLSSGHLEILPPDAGFITLALSELEPGRFYELERSDTLDQPEWHFVRNFNASSSTAILKEPFDLEFPTVYYQLRLVP